MEDRLCSILSVTLDVIKHLMGMPTTNGTPKSTLALWSLLTLLYRLQQQALETGIRRN